MKKYKIAFWFTTGVLFLTQGIGEIFASQSKQAKEGIMDLGYPEYFFYTLIVFKVLGAFALILPVVPKRVKEWAYAGFGFDFIFAFVSIWAVNGLKPDLIPPVIAMFILCVSYYSYHKLLTNKII
jgi:uncharacterized membrane protein YphA (DoxX/SURF4 family)